MLPAPDRILAEPALQAAVLIVVTGDHTWGPQPAEVLDRLTGLRERAILVGGNADRKLMQMALDFDVGLDEDSLSVWGSRQLSPKHIQLLEEMPERVTLNVAGFGSVLFCHATPRDDEEVFLVDRKL